MPHEEEPLTATIWNRIEAARSRWNVLDHPFYRAWSAGELTREDLGDYAGQYRHAVAGIAAMSEQAAEALPELRDHAAEERAHVDLWDRFTAAVGGAEAPATPETGECLAAWSDSSTLGVLARLYAIESAQPEISRVKRAGLVERYGLEEGEGTAYFRIHEARDGAHAAEGRALLERLLADGDEDEVVAAAEAAYRGNWRLLDGVEEKRVAGR